MALHPTCHSDHFAVDHSHHHSHHTVVVVVAVAWRDRCTWTVHYSSVAFDYHIHSVVVDSCTFAIHHIDLAVHILAAVAVDHTFVSHIVVPFAAVDHCTFAFVIRHIVAPVAYSNSSAIHSHMHYHIHSADRIVVGRIHFHFD